jgi:hypothetical protein
LKLKFQLDYLSTNGTDIWLLVNFTNYKEVSFVNYYDELELYMVDTMLLVSLETGLPLGNVSLDSSYVTEVPPLQPFYI